MTGCLPQPTYRRGCEWWDRHGAGPDRKDHSHDHYLERAPPYCSSGLGRRKRWLNGTYSTDCTRRASQADHQARLRPSAPATRRRRTSRCNRRSHRLAAAHSAGCARKATSSRESRLTAGRATVSRRPHHNDLLDKDLTALAAMPLVQLRERWTAIGWARRLVSRWRCSAGCSRSACRRNAAAGCRCWSCAHSSE